MSRTGTMCHVPYTMPEAFRALLALSVSLLMLAGVALATQGESEVRLLQPGVPVQREIAGGQSHFYQINLSAGQYLRAIVDQQGVDLVVTLFGPDDKKVVRSDSPDGANGPERVSLIAEKSGPHRLEVRPLKDRAKAGRYEVRVADLRDPIAPHDFTRVAADKAFGEATTFYSNKSTESLQSAIKKYQEAASLYGEAGERKEEALANKATARVYEWMSNGEAALKHYNQAVAIFQELKDRPSEADIHTQIALLHNRRGYAKKEIDAHVNALKLWRELGDKKAEVDALRSIGWAYNTLGEKPQALDTLNRAHDIARESADQEGMASTLYDIGELLNSLGDTNQCLEKLNQALDIFRALNLREKEAATLTYMGKVYFDTGDGQKSLDNLTRAYAIRRGENDRGAEANSLAHLGRVYYILGEKQKALNYYYQALKLFRAVFDFTGVSGSLTALGFIYTSLGEGQKALEFFDEALPIVGKRGNTSIEGRILLNAGKVHFEQGKTQNAVDKFKKALDLFKAIDERIWKGEALKELAMVYHSTGDHQEALRLLGEALNTFREMNQPRREARVIANIGVAYDAAGDARRAEEHFDQALKLARQLGDQSLEADILYRTARMNRNRGRLAEARSLIARALSIAESSRARIDVQELRASYFASAYDYYGLDIDLLMQLHKADPSKGYDAEALQSSERQRARVLLEDLAESRADISRDIAPALLERKRHLQQQLNLLASHQMRLPAGKDSREQAAAINNKISEAENQYQQVERQIRASSDHYATLMQPRILSLKEIRQMLEPGTLLLEYALGEERSYLLAVTRSSLASFELPRRSEIEKTARRLYESLTARNHSIKFETPEERASRLGKADADYREAATTLSRMVLQPAAAYLKNKRLLVVADGALHYIPFSALPSPASGSEGKLSGMDRPFDGGPRPSPGAAELIPLSVNHEVVEVPSMSTVAIHRREMAGRKPAPKTLVIVADPVFNREDPRFIQAAARNPNNQQARKLAQTAERGATAERDVDRAARGAGFGDAGFKRLPFTESEATAISALVPASARKVAIGFDANRSMVTSPELGQYRFIHFATHGLLNQMHPDLSGIVLSLIDEGGMEQDGYLRAIDVFNLRLSAEMVVLSACSTGLGKEIRGEGLFGLTRAFMYAGAARVVVSLWNVDDQATAEIMKRFYAGMLGKQRLRPATALREAQLSIRKDKRWQSPYYWAGFVLQGEIE